MSSCVIYETLNRYLQKISHNSNCQNIWISYSGGLDSSVLLHTNLKLRVYFPSIKFRALHINHGLLPEANSWMQFCQTICNQNQIELKIERLKEVTREGNSLEESARDARLAIFSKLLEKEDILMTGHHLDDQAETYLLQLLRGAGLKGLASMPIEKSWDNGFTARPFLNISRDEIYNYALLHRIKWIEDSSNSDTKFSRNYVRNKIIPIIRIHYPGCAKVIARSARHAKRANQLIEEYGREDLQKIYLKQRNNNYLSLDGIDQFSSARLKNLIRVWILQKGIRVPSKQKLHQIIKEVILAKEDAKALLEWGDVVVHCYKKRLYIRPRNIRIDTTKIYRWNLNSDLVFNHCILSAKFRKGVGIKVNKDDRVTVRFRSGGERFKIKDRPTKKLKKLFQEWFIPPWERKSIPLIFINDELAGISNLAIAESFCANGTASSITIHVKEVLPTSSLYHTGVSC